MQIHLVSGFLGSGKTTAIQTACNILKAQNLNVGVITNDQGIMLVDTGYFQSNAIPSRQVVNGCFCCNYDALDESIDALVQTNHPDVIFAESVGSCTDIVATVMKPLLKFKKDIKVTVSTFADIRLLHMLLIEKKTLFSEEVTYIYQKQLEEAGTIVVSKVDLVSAEMKDNVQDFLKLAYHGKNVVYINGNDAHSTSEWLKNISQHTLAAEASALAIDYDIYGAGEAKLAWFDESFEIYHHQGNAVEDALLLAAAISQQLKQRNLSVGHLKVLINREFKVSYTTVTESSIPSTIPTGEKAEVVLNARVETDPQTLSIIVSNAIHDLQIEQNCIVKVVQSNAFVPGYPRPTHRITESINA